MMYRQAAVLDEHDLFLPAAQIGDGWWSDVKHGVSNVAGKVANVAKKIQKSSVVRGLNGRRQPVFGGAQLSVDSTPQLRAEATARLARPPPATTKACSGDRLLADALCTMH
jgi:hypothetical protein